MQTEFFKKGNLITPRPEGLDYNLENNKTYRLKWNSWDGYAFLELDGNINLPKNLTETDSDNKFINRILSYFETTDKLTTGVMLTGLKGSGKTVMAKLLSKKSNLPTIVVDPSFPSKKLNNFFTKLGTTKTCVIFDEIDKNGRCWDTNEMLGFLDGIQDAGKKLVLFTCNSDTNISEFMNDRCSRIRYKRVFDQLPDASIKAIGERILTDKSEITPAFNFIKEQFKCISYDNVCSFFEEVENAVNDTYEEIIKDLNITTNGD